MQLKRDPDEVGHELDERKRLGIAYRGVSLLML